MDAAALRPHLVRHSLSPAHLSRAPLGRANTASRRAHRLPPLRARASGGGGGFPKGQGLIGLNGQPLSSSPGGTGGGSGSGGMYLPFLKPAERAVEEGLGSVEELLEVVRERRGLWYEYAPAIGALGRQGLSPAAIAEATGMTGVEQSAVTTAAQVRATLSAAQMDPALLAFFDVGGAEALYELRVLAGAQRKEAAEYVAREGLDGKGARDVARAIKEYERRKREADRSHFSAEPGDCLAFASYRQSGEARSRAEREAALVRAEQVATTDAARAFISTALHRCRNPDAAPPAHAAAHATGPGAAATATPPSLPVARLRSAETQATPMPVVTCAADSGRRSAVVRVSAEAETPQSERLQLNGSVLRADPLWSAVTEQVAIGGSVTTAGAEDVRALQTQFGMTAVVNVEEESAMKARGSSWDEERRRLEEQGVVAVWVPVKEHDATEQALMLPQVVRVVSALVAAGHTVVLQCSSGDRISPLIAIGYLMFVRGMPADAASALVAERRAGISPPMGVLTEAMEKVLAGATARVIEIAESIYRKRERTGQPGDSNSDWVQAQRAYINEAFAKWLAADVSFAESIAQAAERKAREQQAAEEAERRAAGPAKRLLTPIRWSDSAKAPAPPQSAPPAAGAGSSSEALAAANRRVAALSKELEGVTRVADEQAATLQRAGQQVAELTGQVEALQRKERLYTEALAQANERMELLGERMRAVEQQGREEKERLEGEVRSLRARMEADEQRGGRAATVIQGLRMELQAAKDEVKEQWAAVARAEKSIGALSARVKEEEQRAQRAEAAALAAEEDKRRALRELEGAKGESVSESQDARERMSALGAQVQQLSERLKAATSVAEKATGRADVLEKQVAQLEARARKAEEQEAVSARAAGLLTEQVKALEGSAAEAGARVGQLSGELERLRMREAERAAEGVASGERAKQLMALVKELSEKEARQRARTEQVEAQLTALRNQDSELASRAAVFSAQMEEMARQLARLNAELAFAEGREGEVQEAWRAQLGAASDVMGAMGPEAAALAAERGVEMEMEQAEGQPGELLRVLMQRVSCEAAVVRERSARLIEETHHMRQQLDEARNQVQERPAEGSEGAAARLREYVEAAEAMAVEQKQKLVDRVHSLQWLLGATIALAVIIPATAFYSFFTDDSHATQVEMLRSRLAAATSGRQELESAAVKAEASKRAAMSAVQTLEEVVEAQRGSVERLQALIPLVAPSIQSEQAARFCANVPVEYQSPVTQRFCSDIVPPSDAAPPTTAQDTS